MKAMNAEQTRILSASGIHQDAKIGDELAAPRNLAVKEISHTAGHEQHQRDGLVEPHFENSTIKKARVRMKRETVSLFGRFIR